MPELSVRECVNVNDMLQVNELHGSCHHSVLSAEAARSAVLGCCVWHLSRHSADMVTSNKYDMVLVSNPSSLYSYRWSSGA